MLRDLVVRVIVGKRDKDHGHQRNDGEQEKAHHGQRQQGDVETVIGQPSQIPGKAVRLDAQLFVLFQPDDFPNGFEIHDDKEKNYKEGQNTIQQDQEGVVAFHLDVLAQIVVPHIGNMGLVAADVAAAEEILKAHGQERTAEKEHVGNKQQLQSQIDQTATHLTVGDMTQTKHNIGNFCGQLAGPPSQSNLFDRLPCRAQKTNGSFGEVWPKCTEVMAKIHDRFLALMQKPLSGGIQILFGTQKETSFSLCYYNREVSG